MPSHSLHVERGNEEVNVKQQPQSKRGQQVAPTMTSDDELALQDRNLNEIHDAVKVLPNPITRMRDASSN